MNIYERIMKVHRLPKPENGITVLSLFDGMSCGQIALNRAGIKVNKYYASEIDKPAITVTQHNYPDTIQLGDVTKWHEWDIDWSSVDLLIAGSPCQGFSFAGKQLNFDDDRSKLFFVFVDILNHIKQYNPNVKFLLENVRMKQEYKNTITDILGVYPVFINSSLVSAQNRPRLYWANWKITPPKDKGIMLKDILEQETFGTADSSTEHSHVERKNGNGWVSVGGDKSQCLTVCGVTHWQGTYIPISEMDDGKCCVRGALRSPNTCIQVGVVPDLAYEKVARVYSSEGKSPTITKHCDHAEDIPKLATSNNTYRRLTPVECERLQTVPDNYTAIVAQTKRHAMLGNGWTVDVIVHIFSCLWNLD